MHALKPLTLSNNVLTARILPMGATLSGLWLRGTDHSLVLGFQNPSDHIRIPIYAGAIVGPVANRIASGRIALNDAIHKMPLNEQCASLHSGPEGLHARTWDVLHQTTDTLYLRLTLQNGDQGLPGQRDISATYRLNRDTLSLDITATTNQPSPVNIALHPYWNLDGTSDVSRHILKTAAPQYIPTDQNNLPLGEPAPTANTIFDFTTSAPVPLNRALDVNYCLADQSRSVPEYAATLVGANGIKLDIATTAPGLQVYNGAYLPNTKGVLHDAQDLCAYRGIALEPQFWPDAPNQQGFPQITLRPGTLWRQSSVYQITTAT